MTALDMKYDHAKKTLYRLSEAGDLRREKGKYWYEPECQGTKEPVFLADGRELPGKCAHCGHMMTVNDWMHYTDNTYGCRNCQQPTEAVESH